MAIAFSLGAILALFVVLLKDKNFAVLNPAGHIASRQLDLLIFTALLSLVVVVPVFALTIFIVKKYRADNEAEHQPDWDSNNWLELLWWGIPIALILILSVVTWNSTHELDPRKGIASDKKTLTVQVVAMEWKWLFIYPDKNIATVNHLQIPENTPVEFQITSDSAMNSFWIPNLGGQIYAMTGMSSKLNLIADKQGTYEGVSSNISGEGFSGMKFQTKVTSEADFLKWQDSLKQSDNTLNQLEYAKLSQPSKNVAPLFFYGVQDNLYNTIIMKYTEAPGAKKDKAENKMPNMDEMNHYGGHH